MILQKVSDLFWGKWDHKSQTSLSIVDHCADVAACLQMLLAIPGFHHPLARMGGVETLSEVQCARLSVLAGLHDLGKFNHRFQVKPGPSRKTAGHVGPALFLLFNSEDLAYKAKVSLGVFNMLSWADGTVLGALLFTSICHHGKPQECGSSDRQIKDWQPRQGIDPLAGMQALGEAVIEWFPDAFTDGETKLPTTTTFQHGFAGLVTLADWIGSDPAFFPFQIPAGKKRFQIAQQRAAKAIQVLGLDSASFRNNMLVQQNQFAKLFGFAPNPSQATMANSSLENARLTLLEAETGSGKTEAALYHFFRLFQKGHVDGLYFALPTRSAAVQMHDRVRRFIQKMFAHLADGQKPAVLLAVPGYLRMDKAEGQRLAPFETLWSDGDENSHRYWAAENAKRYLTAPIAVGSIDQALMSAIRTPHAQMRATALSRHLLVVDEVHASDIYMTVILESLLDRHVNRCKGWALLMSATLGIASRERLLKGRRANVPPLAQAQTEPYPAISAASWNIQPETNSGSINHDKKVQVRITPIGNDAIAVAKAAWLASRNGAQVLVIRNTVSRAVATQVALESLAQGEEHSLFGCHGLDGKHIPAPHHSRFAADDRRLLDGAMEKVFGKQRPSGIGMVAIATQTVEQSLDIDADFLITDLVPMDVLLQRIGRLQRHNRPRPDGFQEARVQVLTPGVLDLWPFLTREGRTGMDTCGLGTVYPDLRMLQATLEQLQKSTVLSIPTDNRKLVEASCHPDILAAFNQRDKNWQQHGEEIEGNRSAERTVGRLNLINLDDAYKDNKMGNLDEHIATRLGSNDRLVSFTDPVMGPFGQTVKQLRLPAHMAGDGHQEEAVNIIHLEEGGFCFSWNKKTFRYDRLGLIRID